MAKEAGDTEAVKVAVDRFKENAEEVFSTRKRKRRSTRHSKYRVKPFKLALAIHAD